MHGSGCQRTRSTETSFRQEAGPIDQFHGLDSIRDMKSITQMDTVPCLVIFVTILKRAKTF